MGKYEVNCPVCSADVPINGDERKGEEIACTLCSAPLKLTRDASDDAAEAEED